eukprot:gene11378-7884_t
MDQHTQMLIAQAAQDSQMSSVGSSVLRQCWEICGHRHLTREELISVQGVPDATLQAITACNRKCIARQFEVMDLMLTTRELREKEMMQGLPPGTLTSELLQHPYRDRPDRYRSMDAAGALAELQKVDDEIHDLEEALRNAHLRRQDIYASWRAAQAAEAHQELESLRRAHAAAMKAEQQRHAAALQQLQQKGVEQQGADRIEADTNSPDLAGGEADVPALEISPPPTATGATSNAAPTDNVSGASTHPAATYVSSSAAAASIAHSGRSPLLFSKRAASLPGPHEGPLPSPIPRSEQPPHTGPLLYAALAQSRGDADVLADEEGDDGDHFAVAQLQRGMREDSSSSSSSRQRRHPADVTVEEGNPDEEAAALWAATTQGKEKASGGPYRYRHRQPAAADSAQEDLPPPPEVWETRKPAASTTKKKVKGTSASYLKASYNPFEEDERDAAEHLYQLEGDVLLPANEEVEDEAGTYHWRYPAADSHTGGRSQRDHFLYAANVEGRRSECLEELSPIFPPGGASSTGAAATDPDRRYATGEAAREGRRVRRGVDRDDGRHSPSHEQGAMAAAGYDTQQKPIRYGAGDEGDGGVDHIRDRHDPYADTTPPARRVVNRLEALQELQQRRLRQLRGEEEEDEEDEEELVVEEEGQATKEQQEGDDHHDNDQVGEAEEQAADEEEDAATTYERQYDRLYRRFSPFLGKGEVGYLDMWRRMGGTEGWESVLRPWELSLLLSKEKAELAELRIGPPSEERGGVPDQTKPIDEGEVVGFFTHFLSRLPRLEYAALFYSPVCPFDWEALAEVEEPFPSLRVLNLRWTRLRGSDLVKAVETFRRLSPSSLRATNAMVDYGAYKNYVTLSKQCQRKLLMHYDYMARGIHSLTQLTHVIIIIIIIIYTLDFTLPHNSAGVCALHSPFSPRSFLCHEHASSCSPSSLSSE